jgi:hypothetical protein
MTKKSGGDEPVSLAFTRDEEGRVVMVVFEAVSEEVVFEIALAPEIARDAAAKITAQSILAEQEEAARRKKFRKGGK